MRILTFSAKYFISGTTGDAVQMRSTLRALSALGVEAESVFYDGDTFINREGGIIDDAHLKELLAKCDVIHMFIYPGREQGERLGPLFMDKPVVISTVFFQNFTKLKVAWKNRDSFWKFAFMAAGYFYNLIDHKHIAYCRAILPNSWTEGECVLEHFVLPKNVQCFPIPNAISPILSQEEILKSPRSEKVPFDDYAVCPGVFAPRKNQLSLIRALKNQNIPVVFLGGAINGKPDYWIRCKKEKNDKMLFLGYLPSTDIEYWKILAHARVAVLPSDCETPGIAMIEAAYAGARPVITRFGGTMEYYGMQGEYLNPTSLKSIRNAVIKGWERGRLLPSEIAAIPFYSWEDAAKLTLNAYESVMRHH